MADMFSELLSDLKYRLRALFRRRDMERELDDELRDHIEHEAVKLRAAGVAPDEAMRQARVAFGGVENAREGSRDARGVRWLEIIARDLRGAARSLRAQPGFTAIAVVSLAIGVCMAAAIATMRQSVYSGGLAFQNTGNVVAFYEPKGGGLATRSYFVPGDRLRAGATRATQLRDITILEAAPVAIRTDSSDSRVDCVFTAPSLMSLLGMHADLGRAFTAADSAAGAPAVAILSHDFWQSRFGLDSGVIGRSIELEHRLYTIVGVLPRDMTFPSYAQVWAVRSTASMLLDSTHYALQAFARLAPGVTAARATAELTVIARSDSLATHMHGPLPTLGVAPFPDFLIDQFRGLLEILFAIGIAIGLIAAVNFAALVLGRGMRRREELGIRAALGASTGRLVAHMLAECTVLGFAGGVIGAISAPAVIHGLDALIPGIIPPWLHLRIGFTAAVVAIGLAMTIGILFGLAPAIELARPAAAGFLRSGTGGSIGVARQRSSRRSLVTFQVFLAIAPVVFLAIMMGPVLSLRAGDAGYDMNGLLSGTIGGDYRDSTWRAPGAIARMLDVVRSTPGVANAAVSIQSYVSTSDVEVDSSGSGHFVPMNALVQGPWNLVSPGFFDAMKLQLVAGRFPTNDELATGTPVAVVSTRTSRTLVGRVSTGWRARLGTSKLHLSTVTVVGVVADVVPFAFARPASIEFYSPIAGKPAEAYQRGSVWVRGTSSRPSLTGAVYASLHRDDPGATIYELLPSTRSATEMIRTVRGLIIMVVASFGIAVGLAAVGIYGIIAYSAATRRKEFAIRVALGAARTNIAYLVTREAAVQMLIGLALGVLAGVCAVYYMAPNPEVLKSPPIDVIAASCGALLLMLLVASIVPVRRVWRTDTATVLREDG